MDAEQHELERRLKSMRPTGLDEALLERLAGAMGGTIATTPAEVADVESSLSGLRPSVPRQVLRERLDEVVREVPFPVDEKVVLFPRGSAESGKKTARRPWLAAAAAVAVLGALSALFVGPRPQEKAPVAESAPSGNVAAVENGAFVPATFGTDVSGTRNLGVMWSQDQRPMRVVRVVFKDRVALLNDKGERMEVEVPRVEYMLVPEKVD